MQNVNPEMLCIFNGPRTWLPETTTEKGPVSLSQFRMFTGG